MDRGESSTLVGNSNEPPRKNVESLSEKDTQKTLQKCQKTVIKLKDMDKNIDFELVVV